MEDTDEKQATKTTKTVWDWEVINANKPIWTRNAKDVEEEEYKKFYKAFTKAEKDPLGYIHFTAEGEVTFRSILYIPPEAPAGFFTEYGKNRQVIKLYVRRVFITDEFDDLMPKYLGFLQGVVDSDDLPLNVSRETLQQHKLLKVRGAIERGFGVCLCCQGELFRFCLQTSALRFLPLPSPSPLSLSEPCPFNYHRSSRSDWCARRWI